RAAVLAPREQQRRRQSIAGREDERTAVAAGAEGAGSRPLDLDLIVEPKVAEVVFHDHVVDLEGRHLSVGMAAGSAELLHEAQVGGGSGERPEELPRAVKDAGLEADPIRAGRRRAGDVVYPARAQSDESIERSHGVEAPASPVEPSRL